MSFGKVFNFPCVFQSEVNTLNKRRPADHQIALELESEDTHGRQVKRPTAGSDIIGLALSGGGIRSASFCLGALQALHTVGVLNKVDYLSTVSGGGYIGTSFIAAMHGSEGKFPFESKLAQDETTSVQHIRDHSNYLFAGGAGDVLDAVAIYIRGLVVNAVLILPWLLLAAAGTIYLHPTQQSLLSAYMAGYFTVTAYLALIAIALFFVWGMWPAFRTIVPGAHSATRATGGRIDNDIRPASTIFAADTRPKPTRPIEVPRPSTKLLGALVVVILVSAFFELQPFLLYDRFQPSENRILHDITAWVQKATVVLAPFAAVMAFMGRRLGEMVKSATEASGKGNQFLAFAAKAAIYVVAAFVPLLLWAIYLQLSYWGIEPYVIHNINGYHRKTPEWLVHAATMPLGFKTLSIANLYVTLAVSLLAAAVLLRPNSNSLHPLYRDRLSKAFLFKPKTPLARIDELSEAFLKVSDLSENHHPYHLINTALNVQSSKIANRRGRNADFFIFGRNFCGSEATGYVKTQELEQVATDFDLATAMAVSGAAASSNMGAASIKPLTPTLAILNVRLGYWLRNPRQIFKKEGWNKLANFYFVAELFGLLNENRKSVYLTDGGHIENLGIYELLKRRCKVIIAVDAEADPEMAFGSLNTMERYARIDLGVRIDLPWQKLTNVARTIAKAIDETGDCPKLSGPHCAIGEIEYPENRKGVLVYIKASLTGDENDYVFHYKKRYSRFPHETTLDQMFSEEQFEAYRALGYHAAFGLFDRRDSFAHLSPDECPEALVQIALLDRLFPRVTTGGAPTQRENFSDWL
jgi:hypothetical protein